VKTFFAYEKNRHVKEALLLTSTLGYKIRKMGEDTNDLRPSNNSM
jgi:hypothetical protein